MVGIVLILVIKIMGLREISDLHSFNHSFLYLPLFLLIMFYIIGPLLRYK